MNNILFGSCQPIFVTGVPLKKLLLRNLTGATTARKIKEGTSSGTVKYQRMVVDNLYKTAKPALPFSFELFFRLPEVMPD